MASTDGVNSACPSFGREGSACSRVHCNTNATTRRTKRDLNDEDGETEQQEQTSRHKPVDKRRRKTPPHGKNDVARFFDLEAVNVDTDEDSDSDENSDGDDNDEQGPTDDATSDQIDNSSSNSDDNAADDSSSDSDEDANDAPILLDFCQGCHRHELISRSGEYPDYMYLDVCSFPKADVRFRRKYCPLRQRDAPDNIALCRHCAEYLVLSGKNSQAGIWTCFLWHLLQQNPSEIWHFFSPVMRRWWYTAAKKLIDVPTQSCIVRDITTAKQDLDLSQQDGLIGNIMKQVDKHLFTTVLCPWGCTTHPDAIGTVPFDCIIQTKLEYLDLPMYSSSTEFLKVLTSRVDYIRASPEDYANLLLNPSWKVQPCIIFQDNTPFFATCPLHHGGTKEAYFHAPRLPLYAPIPAKRSDQLSHVVLKPRILKGKRRKIRNTTYETVEVRACFTGSDTANVTDVGDFSFISHLTERNESLAIMGRLDIRSHLFHLANDGWLTHKAVRSMTERAQKYFGHVDLNKWKAGSTFMTLPDAVCLQREIMREDNIFMRAIVESTVHRGRTETKQFTRKWPASLVWVQRATAAGARFSDLPQLRTKHHDSRYAWIMLAVLSTQAPIWTAVDVEIHNPNDWNGWFLLFAATKCLTLPYSYRSKEKNHPYKSVPTIEHLCKLVEPSNSSRWTRGGTFNSTHLHRFFRPFSNISCVDLTAAAISEQQITEKLRACADHCHSRNNADERMHPVIVATRSSSAPSFGVTTLLPVTFLSSDGVRFHLSLIALTPENESSQQWTGTIVVRHDPKEFGHWWYQERGRKMTACSSLESLQIRFWTLAVYVREVAINNESLRAEYLTYIGGQARIFCTEHDVPLITASSYSQDRCYTIENGTVCNKKVAYCCPVSKCLTWLCSRCYKEKTSAGSGVVKLDSCPQHIHNVSATDNLVETGTPSRTNESVELQVDDEESANDVFVPEAYGALDDNDSVLILDPAMADDDDHLYDTTDMAPPLIPTTNCAQSILDLRPNVIPGDSNYQMPGHVLLNAYGTLLVRRNRKLNGSKLQQHFLQKVVATRSGTTIPTMFLEGALFPSIFWAASRDNSSTLGCIPSSLLAQPKTVSSYGIASLRDHSRTRISSADSLSGTDPRYLCFVFDAMANQAMNNNHSRAVLHRGFVENEGPCGLAVRDKTSQTIVSDLIDSRETVRTLSAAERDQPFTLFATFTANHLQQFGIRQIAQWLRQTTWQNHYHHCEHLDDNVIEEIHAQLDQAAAWVILRNWFRVRYILLDYIVNSVERVLGHVEKLFARDEYQGDEGNLPHVHCLIRLVDGIETEEALRFVQDLIRGSSAELVRADEVDNLISRHILADEHDWFLLQEDGRSYLGHNRCNPRCMRRLMDGSLVCRVIDNWAKSPDPLRHVHVTYNPGHSIEAIRLFADLGLCEQPPADNPLYFKPLVPVLVASKHFPPSHMSDGKFSACNGTLFAICRGNQNLQLCKTFSTSRYLCKYLGKIDENNSVWLVIDTQDERSATLQTVFLHNTKISGAAEQRLIDNQARRKTSQRGRSMAVLEVYQRCAGIPSTISNFDHINVATTPMEERVGFYRRSPVQTRLNPRFVLNNQPQVHQLRDLHADMVETISSRKSLQAWRQFTPEQEIVIRDMMFSTVTTDKITLFSVRPCELVQLFDTVEIYFKFFLRNRTRLPTGTCANFLCQQSDASSWIDGSGFIVKLRYRAIDSVTKYLGQIPPTTNPEILQIFRRLKMLKDICVRDELRLPASSADADFFTRFVDFESQWDVHNRMRPRTLPTIVFSDVKPTNPTKFLLHLLLSMGSFVTEYGLLHQRNMVEAFAQAKLVLPRGSVGFAQSVDNLISRYITDQLAYAPITTRQLDFYAVEAARIIYDCLLHQRLTITAVPPVLFTSTQAECAQNIERALSEKKQILLDTVFEHLHWLVQNSPNFPSKAALLDGSVTKSRPHPWLGKFVRNVPKGQTMESFEEHETTSQSIRRSILQYCSATSKFVKCVLLAGPPGCGKTFNLMFAMAYGLSHGLYCMTTALLSARARTLGGIHYHQLFKLKATNKSHLTPQRMAEDAVIAVMKEPMLYALFMRLDALGLDEFGQMSAQLLCALDIFLRRIRGVNTFFGGVLLFCTIDHLQIKPIDGIPVLLSPHILTSFKVHELVHSVRAAKDPNLQEIVRLSRLQTNLYTQDILDTLINLISSNCTFVDKWTSPLIPPNAVRLFGRRAPVQDAERTFRRRERKRCANRSLPYIVRDAVDTQIAIESHGQWQEASVAASKHLDAKMREPRQLLFTQYATFELTYNEPGQFSHSQLAVLCDLPERQAVADFKPFEILVAPPGHKFIRMNITSKQQLLDLGYKPHMVGPAPLHSSVLKNRRFKARRQQYGLRPKVASTLHAAMGAELDSVVTEMNLDIPGLQLWEKGQFVVLVSRTDFAHKLIFVGNKEACLKTIRHIVQVRSQYDNYIHHILDVLARGTQQAGNFVSPPIVDLSHHVLRPRDVALPQGGTGVCYLLISCKDLTTTYIGQTLSYVGDRLNQHNSGYGALQTAPIQYRPWALFACVVGFDGNRQLLLGFERDWQARRNAQIVRNHGSITPMETATLAPVVMNYQAYKHLDLRFIRNGDIVARGNETTT